MLTGCQASDQAKQQAPESVVSSPTLSSGSPEQTPTLGRREPSAINSMPLALVVNATRPTADVGLADARRVVESGATRWSAIGQSGGRMRVLTTRDRRAGEVLRAVRSSANVLGLVPADAVDPRVRVLTVGGRHPLREPESYPLRTRSVDPVPEVTSIAAVGDIMLGRRVSDRHRADPGAPLKPLAKRLAGAEITVGNFESTLSTAGSPTQGGDSFAASPRVTAGCEQPGSTYSPWLTTMSVTMATERCARPGPLAKSKIDTVGAGRDLARRAVR